MLGINLQHSELSHGWHPLTTAKLQSTGMKDEGQMVNVLVGGTHS